MSHTHTDRQCLATKQGTGFPELRWAAPQETAHRPQLNSESVEEQLSGFHCKGQWKVHKEGRGGNRGGQEKRKGEGELGEKEGGRGRERITMNEVEAGQGTCSLRGRMSVKVQAQRAETRVGPQHESRAQVAKVSSTFVYLKKKKKRFIVCIVHECKSSWEECLLSLGLQRSHRFN